MKTAEQFAQEFMAQRSREKLLTFIRRIQADALVTAADICMRLRCDSGDNEDCAKAILAEADKLEL